MILDSCILIDLSRNKPEAHSFLKSMDGPPGISAITVTEVLHGVRDAEEQNYFYDLFKFWDVIPVTFEIAEEAGLLLRSYRKSHGLDAIDGTIAATAKVLDRPFITLNLKHFPMFEGLKRPY